MSQDELDKIILGLMADPDFEAAIAGGVEAFLEKRGVKAYLRPFIAAVVIGLVTAEVAKLKAPA